MSRISPPSSTQGKSAAASFFETERIHVVRIHLEKDEWDALQPKRSLGFLQMDFPERAATIRIDGREVPVSLRFKGNGTYMASGMVLKRPFKASPVKPAADLGPGLPTRLNLNNNIMDDSGIREAMAYAMFRDLGVPAPRTAFAQVVLDVPGLARDKTLGLYTIAEQVDDRFFERYDGIRPTLLLKPENATGLPKPKDWKAAEAMYDPKGKPTDRDKARFLEFLDWIHESDDRTFARRLPEFLDVAAFARFLATTAVSSSLDSILALGHNYYLMLHPRDGRFRFLPWDLDLAFGGFPVVGADPVRLDIRRPAVERERLIERFLGVAAARTEYQAACAQAAAWLERAGPLRRRLAARVAALRAKEDRTPVPGGVPGMPGFPPGGGFGPPAGGPGPGGFGPPPGARSGPGGPPGFGKPGANPFQAVSVEKFLAERPVRVRAQLAGKETGERPKGFPDFGGPGGPGGPGGFDLASMVALGLDGFLGGPVGTPDRDAWRAAWEKRLRAMDTNGDAVVSGDEWKKAIDTAYAGQPAFARILPDQVRRALGKDSVPVADALRTIDTWFDRFDRDRDAKLARKEIGEGLLGVLPPPDFGAGGGFPGFGG